MICVDVKMGRSEDEKINICRSEDERMITDLPLLEECFVQTLWGKPLFPIIGQIYREVYQ